MKNWGRVPVFGDAFLKQDTLGTRPQKQERVPEIVKITSIQNFQVLDLILSFHLLLYHFSWYFYPHLANNQ